MTIPAGYAQVTHEFNGSGVPTGAAVVFGVINQVAQTASAIATECHDAYGDLIMPLLVQNVGLAVTRVKLGPDATGAFAQVGGERGGEDLSAQAPPNVAYLVTKITNLGGRRGRGRMYIPGVDETQIDQGGNVQNPVATDLQTALDDWLVRLDGSDIPVCILHEPGESTEPLPTLVTALQLQTIVATQRRRVRR